jgi:hypothetical protein
LFILALFFVHAASHQNLLDANVGIFMTCQILTLLAKSGEDVTGMDCAGVLEGKRIRPLGGGAGWRRATPG